MKKKVVIIGAGPAGLTAGYELLKSNKNYDVLILEESADVGGISKTIKYKGNRMDLGGHRFFSKDEQIKKFWQEILPIQGKPAYDDKILKRQKQLPKKGPNPEKEDEVMLKRNRVSRIFYLNKFFNYPVTISLNTFKNLGFKNTCLSGASYFKSLMIKKEEVSLENFYINRFGYRLYSTFFEGYTEKLWGRHPSKISADWGAQRVKGVSVMEVLRDGLKKLFHLKSNKKETSLIEEFWYPKYGPGQLWESVLKKYKKLGGKIKKNSKVTKIICNKNKIIAVKCGQSEIKGDIFISSMPLKDLIESMEKSVPKNIQTIARGLPYRDFITVGLLVKKIKLKNETNIKTLNNLIPDCWIYVQDKKVKLGRIQIFNNWSPYMVKKPEETVWLGLEYFCNENEEFWHLKNWQLKDVAIKDLVSMGLINKEDVLDYHVEKVKKAYPAYFDTYEQIDELKEYLNKFENLYCVGRNGQHRYNNMDHSMLTSMKAVENIIAGKKDKNNIWEVNVEKDYHEKKNK